jgi:alkyl hydroperoxide reductase subunit F
MKNFITKDFLSQSSVSDSIENWIGAVKITGVELAKSMEAHVKAYAKDENGNEVLTIITGRRGNTVAKMPDGTFEVTDSMGDKYNAKAIFIATGGNRRKLDATGADIFEHKGITYCASCDGPLFSGKDVAVIGGGNAGFETAAQLSAYVKSVSVLHYKKEFKADPVTLAELQKIPNIKLINNAVTKEVYGEKFVKGLKYQHAETGEMIDLPVEGIFVEVGNIPNTDLVKDLVKLSPYNAVEIDPWTGRASVEGIWSAGDCTNVKYHQNNIAVGDAVKCLEDLYLWIKTKKA